MKVVAKWWITDYKSPLLIYGFMGDSMQTILGLLGLFGKTAPSPALLL